MSEQNINQQVTDPTIAALQQQIAALQQGISGMVKSEYEVAPGVLSTAADMRMGFPQPQAAVNAWGQPTIQQIPQWESVSVPLNIELESGQITPMLTFPGAVVPTPQALTALLNALDRAGFPLKTWKRDAKKSWGK